MIDEEFNEELLSIVGPIQEEVTTARHRWGSWHSAHEGFAILQEEIDELWDCVKTKQGIRDLDKMRKEAIQVAAMAIRFAIEVCNEKVGRR